MEFNSLFVINWCKSLDLKSVPRIFKTNCSTFKLNKTAEYLDKLDNNFGFYRFQGKFKFQIQQKKMKRNYSNSKRKKNIGNKWINNVIEACIL